MKALVLMSDVSVPVIIPKRYKAMLDSLSGDWKWHVSQYTTYTTDYVLWHEEGCHHEYTWLTTERLEDMLMAIEYLYHYRIGGQQVEWEPKGQWLDKGYKALVNL